jgi:outer membrane protein assembly factor BamB
MSIVRKGKIVWTYTDTTKRGEISDAVLLSNGNILFAHQFGITEIDKDKNLVWNYDAPPNTEIHTARPIGKNRVLYIQNGNPGKMLIVDIKSGKTLFEKELEVRNPLVTHPQFRHANITSRGTVLVAHMDMDKVCEYNEKGDIIWSEIP